MAKASLIRFAPCPGQGKMAARQSIRASRAVLLGEIVAEVHLSPTKGCGRRTADRTHRAAEQEHWTRHNID